MVSVEDAVREKDTHSESDDTGIIVTFCNVWPDHRKTLSGSQIYIKNH